VRVLVFEQWLGGHYFNYLELLVPRLAELADEVIVAMTRAAIDSERFKTQLGAVAALPRVRFEASVPRADPALPWRERMQLLLNLKAAVAEARPDYLLVPSADAQTLAMGAFGHVGISILPRELPSEATFHNGYGPAIRNRKQAVKELIYRAGYSGCTWSHLNFVNFLYFEHAARERRSWIDRARLVADPVPRAPRLDRVAARRLLGIPEQGRYLGLLGGLDQRKALPELLAAFRAAALGAQDRLLLGGRLDDGFRRLIDSDYQDLVRSDRLVLIDRFLTDDELLQGFGALDLVCATYRDFPGLASLMLKGLAAGRPVLAQNFGWSEALINRFAIGHTVDIYQIQEFAKTLRTALEVSGDYVETEAVRRLLSFHEPANFTATMSEHLRCLTGKAATHEIKTWDWVLEGRGNCPAPA
jgi:glycosyltransferase involved in cell wall biosynthesis